ncbi:MAG: hypothetical protein [Microviridae sp.]|nr:MAG: hypothetical protein [Microviridae sp.]
MKLYALHDKKAKALSNFNVERSDAVASRLFAEAVNQQNSILSKYPEDFELVSLCDVSQEYEDLSDLQLVSSVQFSVVLTAAQVVSLRPQQDGQLSLLKEA